MRKMIVTPITKDINAAVDTFKYQRGRILNIVLSSLIGASGIALCFFGIVYLAVGIILILIAIFFLLSFTVLWPLTLKKIIERNQNENPVASGAELDYLFTDNEVTITLKRKDMAPQSESHTYDFFSAMDLTNSYLFLVYGDPKKDPAFPVIYDSELLAFLQSKITAVHDYRRKTKSGA
jgi:hypothetical protein